MIEKLTRAVLTVGLAGACVWMWIGGQTPPDALLMLASGAVGTYYSGVKNAMTK